MYILVNDNSALYDILLITNIYVYFFFLISLT